MRLPGPGLILLQIIFGFAFLFFAGDSLVRGAVNLSLRLGVPPFIVSLTVVAFGTSAPELLVSVRAVLDGAPGIALGNAVGSNTANILLVLGAPALLAPIAVPREGIARGYFQMIAASLLFIGIAWSGTFNAVGGLILLAALAFILTHSAIRADRSEPAEGTDPSLKLPRIAIFLIIGLVGLPLGAELLIRGAADAAKLLGVGDEVIGLTLIAFGTSLPELATTISATLRRQSGVILGNVIGSNLFNLLAIIGISSLVGSIPVPREFLRLDLWIMLAASLALLPFVLAGWRLNRVVGAVFTALYTFYIVFLLT